MKSYDTMDLKNLKVLRPEDYYKKYSHRYLMSSITLPSQYSSYAVCVEHIRDWFVTKFPPRFFNSIYVEGAHSFDEFRKFSQIQESYKKSNPLLAIIPVIDMEHNRDWIDSNPAYPMVLKRARMEGTFFNDIRDNRGLHLQLQFKTILMNFTFKIRLDTKAEALDMMEWIKMHCRAGWSESHEVAIDAHVPRSIITQIAWDNGIRINEDGTPVDSTEMLAYLNQYSVIPFLYKLRAATGNSEYFIKIPNCMVRLKMNLPQMDDGERQEHLVSNFNIDFTLECEMTAPYCYTYYSQTEHRFVTGMDSIYDKTYTAVCIDPLVRTDVPPIDEHNWKMLTEEPIQYEVDDEDLKKECDIDFKPMFHHTDLGMLIKWNLDTQLKPEMFMNFKVFNGGIECEYTMDWENLIMHISHELTHNTIIIGLYTDNKYINETLIYLRDAKNNPSRVRE